jgi:hypothetical protein
MSPNRSPNYKEPAYVYRRRRLATAISIFAVTAALAGEAPKLVKDAFSTPLVTELAHPFSADQAATAKGGFSPGSVSEMRLPPISASDGSLPYDYAVAVTGPSGSQNAIYEASADIEAETGGEPSPGEKVYLPTKDIGSTYAQDASAVK